MSSGRDAAHRRADWQRWTMESIQAGRDRTDAGLATVGEIESLQDKARREGREEGLAQGRSQGLAAITAEAERMRSILAALEGSCDTLQDEIAQGVLDLALDIARQVLQEALPVRRELLLPVVREAIRGMPAGNARILLNPADVELVRAHFGEELRVNGWQIVEDHRIQPGGCRLNSPQCDLDATLETRWNRVIASLGKDHAWLDA